MGGGYGCGFGCAKARLGPKGRSETCPSGGVCLCLGSFCLAVCLYSGVSELVLGKLSGSLRFLLSFSLCFPCGCGFGVCVCVWVALAWRSADHQPNARSAQTGVADKLMERFADHDPLDGPLCGPSSWGSGSSSFRRRSPYPLI